MPELPQYPEVEKEKKPLKTDKPGSLQGKQVRTRITRPTSKRGYRRGRRRDRRYVEFF